MSLLLCYCPWIAGEEEKPYFLTTGNSQKLDFRGDIPVMRETKGDLLL